MSRLIDADALIHELNNSHYPGAPYVDAGISIAIGKVCDAPTIEPEIVRCKDCKFYSPMNKETKTGICNLTMHQNFGDDWFCAGAERRADERSD